MNKAEAYGGHFGRWIDDAGLPAYRYECDPDTDPAAQYPTMHGKPSTDHWHAFGNHAITAVGCGRGWVRFFDSRHGPVWWQQSASNGAPFAGGAVRVTGDRSLSTIHAADAPVERTFGAAWLRKRVASSGLELEQVCFCPDGDDAIVLSFSTLCWRGAGPLRIRLGEYWALDPKTPTFLGRGRIRQWLARSKHWQLALDKDRHSLVARPLRPDAIPKRPKLGPIMHRSAALLALSHLPDAVLADAATFFGEGFTTAGLRKSAQTVSMPSCLALATDLVLRPNEPITIAHGFAVGTDSELAMLAAKYRHAVPAVFARTVAAWSKRTPRLTIPGEPWAGREMAWSAAQLCQASVADDYFGTKHITQGGNYLFASGFDAAPRDPCQHALAALHVDPALAIETLRTLCRMQQRDGTLTWGMGGYGMAAHLAYLPFFLSGDLDLWLLWSAAEIILATRQHAILDEPHPWYPRDKDTAASIREHLRIAFRHFVDSVGLGAHGLPHLRWGDWNDEMLWLSPSMLSVFKTARDGESTFSATLAVHALARYAELLRFIGDDTVEVEAVRTKILGALKTAFTGRWFNRAWVGTDTEIGRDHLYLEPQSYALLAGIPDEAQARVLIHEINARLRQNSPIGAAIHEKPMVGRSSEPGTLENGGVWFAVSGPLVLGLARYDRELAFDEWRKFSLAQHAVSFPDRWFGIWSGPDSFNSFHSPDHGGTWIGRLPILGLPLFAAQDWPCMNTHAHGWPLQCAAHLAGFSADAAGYIFAPRFPERILQDGFSWLGDPWSLEWTSERIAGHVSPGGDARFRIRIEGPHWADARAEVDGVQTKLVRVGDGFEFSARASAGGRVQFSCCAAEREIPL